MQLFRGTAGPCPRSPSLNEAENYHSHGKQLLRGQLRILSNQFSSSGKLLIRKDCRLVGADSEYRHTERSPENVRSRSYRRSDDPRAGRMRDLPICSHTISNGLGPPINYSRWHLSCVGMLGVPRTRPPWKALLQPG